jgi:hypothetical protein
MWMAQSGLACSCADLGPFCKNAPDQQPWTHFGEQTIFVGTAIDVDPDWLLAVRDFWSQLLSRPLMQERKARLRVTEGFVGESVKEFEVSTGPARGGDCGVPFKSGESYFVVAFRSAGTGLWGTSICSRTRLLKYATEDVAALRAWKRGEQRSRRIFGVVDRDSGPSNLLLRSDAATQKISPDRDGHFLVENLESTQYYLDVDLPERRLYVQQSGNGRLGSTDRRPIDLTMARCAELYVAISPLKRP